MPLRHMVRTLIIEEILCHSQQLLHMHVLIIQIAIKINIFVNTNSLARRYGVSTHQLYIYYDVYVYV